MIEVQPPLASNETVVAWVVAPEKSLSGEMVGYLGGASLYALAYGLATAPVISAARALLGTDVHQVRTAEKHNTITINLPWRGIVCGHTLGMSFIRQAAQQTYEDLRKEHLDPLVQWHSSNNNWRGQRGLSLVQRNKALAGALPYLVLPEDIDRAGLWLPKENESR